VEKLTYVEIPGNSRREFEDARFPGIPGNSRTGIPGGPARDLRSFEIRFEFESDDSDSNRFEGVGLIRNFSNQLHLPS